MSSKLNKIKVRITSLKTTYENDKRFSPELAKARLSLTLTGYLRGNTVEKSKRVNDLITQYLKKDISDVISEIKNKPLPTLTGNDDSPIWVCWWQGEEQAPEIVKQCIKSIRTNTAPHPLHLITKDNYLHYLEIPSYILEKVKDGRMGIANFSDYLRYSLLDKYGGLWLDATIFAARPIEHKPYFELPLFTCNTTDGTGMISYGKWTGFCVGGYAHHPFFEYMKLAFESYWQRHDTSIDYLLVDYLTRVGYDSISTIRDAIDAVPINNMHRNDLAAAMVTGQDGQSFAKYLSEDTDFYKLSWREKYPMKTTTGNDTVLAAFLQMKL